MKMKKDIAKAKRYISENALLTIQCNINVAFIVLNVSNALNIKLNVLNVF